MTRHLICRVYWLQDGCFGGFTKMSFRFGASEGIRCVTSPGLRRSSGASWLVLYSALYRQRHEWGNPGSTKLVTGKLPDPRLLFGA